MLLSPCTLERLGDGVLVILASAVAHCREFLGITFPRENRPDDSIPVVPVTSVITLLA